MTEFKTVGFTKDNEDNIIIPEGLNQFYTQVFDEFKLIHLIAFLYCNRAKKVIIFVSSCETVNFLYELLKDFEFINGNIKLFSSVEMLKLHGKMKHDERKVIFKSFFNSTKCIYYINHSFPNFYRCSKQRIRFPCCRHYCAL